MPSSIDNLFALAHDSSPFASETVTVRAHSTGADGLSAESVSVTIRRASVQDAGSPQFLEGADPAPWRFVIRFPAGAWTASVPLTAGSTVDAEGARPELRVVQVQCVAGILHLKCSAREGARNG